MTSQRRHKTSDPFDMTLEGCLGQFALQEKDSTPVYFLTATLNLDQLERLETAKDAIPDTVALDFDAMIQREINPDHVQDIEKYFRGESRIRFFPPLLAAIIETNSRGIVPYYPDCVVTKPTAANDHYLEMTWGDLFQCRVGADADGTARSIQLISPDNSGVPYRVLPYLGVVRINTSKAKLVVVDGQHRLKALRNLRADHVPPEERARFDPLTVSVCFFWTPSTKNVAKAQDVVYALRSVFVDVNSKAHKVSGHFEILLKDTALGSLAVRSFCEHARQDLLPYIEWDQHEYSQSYQLTLPDKITSVGILSESLSKSGVSSLGKTPDNHIMARVLPYLLSLEKYRTALETAGAPSNFAQLTKWDAPFYPQQRSIIKKAMDEHLAPCLGIIFRDTLPYARIREIAKRTQADWLKCQDGPLAQRAARSMPSVIKPSDTSVAQLRSSLVGAIEESLSSDDTQPLNLVRTQRFQQGLFGAYYLFLNTIVNLQLEVPATAATRAFVDYLNKWPLRDNSVLLRPNEQWNWGTIYRSATGALNKSTSTRIPVAHALLAHLGDRSCASAVAQHLVAQDEGDLMTALALRLQQQGAQAASLLLARYSDSLAEDIISNLEYEEINDKDRERYLELRNIREGTRRDQSITKRQADKKLREAIEAQVQARIRPIASRLQSTLGFAIENETSPIVAGTEEE